MSTVRMYNLGGISKLATRQNRVVFFFLLLCCLHATITTPPNTPPHHPHTTFFFTHSAMPSNGNRRPLPLTVTSTSKATGAAVAPAGPWVRRSNDPDGGLLFRNGSSNHHHHHHNKNKSPPTPQGRDWGGGDDAQVKPITNYYRRGSGGPSSSGGRRSTSNYAADDNDDDDDVMEPSPPRSVDERLAQIRLANSQVFHNDAFRPMQEDIILGALAGRDCFVLMPTGGGKSLCYQLPAIVTRGVTLVVSPLISLIQDQVSALITQHRIPAAVLNSTTSETVVRQIYRDLYSVRRGKEPTIKLLYVTPERLLKSVSFQDLLNTLHEHGMLARFVIDECHCVSQVQLKGTNPHPRTQPSLDRNLHSLLPSIFLPFSPFPHLPTHRSPSHPTHTYTYSGGTTSGPTTPAWASSATPTGTACRPCA